MIKSDGSQKQLLNWLSLSLILVLCIIIVGGLTRLTNSGLSITHWELFKGILPPLSQASWIDYYEQYKKIPQFELVNFDMDLSRFKIIFYWEYFHRMLARLIGVFFLIPLIYLHYTNKIEKKYIIPCYLILALIILQGIVGWYMVKSGLVNAITVSHYRLSLHLSIAFVIISSIFWLILNLKENNSVKFFGFSKKNILILFLLFLIFSQIILGAFVSGLDAGKIYQTWPLMGLKYFPDDSPMIDYISYFNFNNHSLVQFYHRNLAYLITFYILGFSLYIYLKKIKNLYRPLLILIFFLILQVILGITTLTSGLNMFLASAHQITSVFLVFSTINLYYNYIK